MRRAVIDIGTNTVKLLVADVQDGQVRPVFATDTTTRLGEGLATSHRLSPAAITRTVHAVAELLAEARRRGTAEVLALTTAAAREAVNRDEFLAAVRDRCGLAVEIVTGEREAALIFRGVCSDPAFAGKPLLVLDVGGGSGELVQGKDGRMEKWVSLPVGAVRLTESVGDDFARVSEYLRRELPGRFAGFSAAGRQMVGTGGGIVTLGKIAAKMTLTLDEVRAWAERLSAMSLAERKRVPGLPPERADIIVAGGAVFVVAMELLGASKLTVSTRSLRYGALV